MPGLIRNFVTANIRWSRWLGERLDPKSRRIDGCQDFPKILSEYLHPGMRVLDVGGGRRPAISAARKATLHLKVFGLDVSQAELDGAPAGTYDQLILCDLSVPTKLPEVDLAISRSVTEHVRDPRMMYTNIYRALRAGGTTLNFIPNKFAFFALLNALTSSALSTPLLNFFYPELGETHFRAYYRKCYPSAIAKLLRHIGYEKIEFRLYWRSDYFCFFLPFHLLDVCRQLIGSHLRRAILCETFTLSARKPLTEGP